MDHGARGQLLSGVEGRLVAGLRKRGARHEDDLTPLFDSPKKSLIVLQT